VGILSALTGYNPVAKPSVTASVGIMPTLGLSFEQGFYVTRTDAMSVPALARARNIIAGTIGTLPLDAYDRATGAYIEGKTFLEQPDKSCAYVVTVAYTAEDLLFRGVAYWMIMDVWPEDGRPKAARRIDPSRITYQVDPITGLIIDGFYIDGRAVPNSGVGSLIMFNGIDEGLLARAGRTIKTAIDLEKAAQRMANEPAPSMVLKNSGVDLPENQVTSLLNNWKSARQNRATAYLGGNINVEAFGFDAMQMQLVEARRHLSTEIARAVGIPAWYLNAEYASETYSNVQQERRTLIDFSLRPILHAIEERLSMDDITPRNQEVRFDLDDYMRGNPMDMADYVEKLLNLQLIDIPQAQEMLEILPSKEQA